MEVDDESKAATDAAATETVKPVVLVGRERLICSHLNLHV